MQEVASSLKATWANVVSSDDAVQKLQAFVRENEDVEGSDNFRSSGADDVNLLTQVQGRNLR